MPNLVRDRNEAAYNVIPGGRRDDTCDHGLFRRSLKVESFAGRAGI